jgi:hypothetical protein
VFTKRHEQELAEIKALTYELDRRVQEVLEQLRDIRESQGLAPAGDEPGPDGAKSPAKSIKKSRLRQATTPGVAAAGGAKPGKRRGARKRRQAEPAGASEEE